MRLSQSEVPGFGNFTVKLEKLRKKKNKIEKRNHCRSFLDTLFVTTVVFEALVKFRIANETVQPNTFLHKTKLIVAQFNSMRVAKGLLI